MIANMIFTVRFLLDAGRVHLLYSLTLVSPWGRPMA